MQVEWVSLFDRLPAEQDADMNNNVWVLGRTAHDQPHVRLMHYKSLEPNTRTQIAWARTGLDRDAAYAAL